MSNMDDHLDRYRIRLNKLGEEMKTITKFYQFDQNNSGGHFIVNENLCNIVVIEAESPEQANEKAKDLGIYFYGTTEGSDCPCCGDRWYKASNSDGNTLNWFNTSEVNVSGCSKEELSPQFADRIELDAKKVVVNNIEEYYQIMADMWSWTSPAVRICFMDGTVKEIYSNKIKYFYEEF